MRYPASEKLEIIRLVEQSHLPVRRTLEKLGIQPARFYRWYDRLQTSGPEALEDKSPRSKRVWNRIPDAIRERIVQLALDEPELSPRELATRFKLSGAYGLAEGPSFCSSNRSELACALITAVPSRMLWGTDWPHTMCPVPMPNDGDLLDLFGDWVPEEEMRLLILVENPAKLYDFGS